MSFPALLLARPMGFGTLVPTMLWFFRGESLGPSRRIDIALP